VIFALFSRLFRAGFAFEARLFGGAFFNPRGHGSAVPLRTEIIFGDRNILEAGTGARLTKKLPTKKFSGHPDLTHITDPI
jgi:hypothetical protein